MLVGGVALGMFETLLLAAFLDSGGVLLVDVVGEHGPEYRSEDSEAAETEGVRSDNRILDLLSYEAKRIGVMEEERKANDCEELTGAGDDGNEKDVHERTIAPCEPSTARF